MIQLIEGPPGSGKSYFAMNYLVGFTEYDELYNEYILRQDVLIIANIEGLKIKHWDLDYCLRQKTPEEFFTIENFEAIQKKTGKSHIILVVDECHEIFPPSMKNQEVYKFFAFHRHIGLDVVLMTQGIDSMTRMFNPLLEVIVKATPRSKKLSKSFGYKYCDLRGKFLYPKTISVKKKVFGAYKSFRVDEKNKPRSAVMFWLIVVGVFLLSGGSLIAYAITGLGGKDLAESDKKTVISSVKLMSNPKIKNSPLLLDRSAEEAWDVYHVQGYVEKAGKVYYLIGGKSFPHSAKFRKFDRFNLTVEYFGLEIGQRGGGDSAILRKGAEAEVGAAVRFSQPSAGPLARNGP